jgi:hypothetical protein
MYTGIAILIGCVLAWLADRGNKQDRVDYDREVAHPLLLHIRQDVKVICFLLFGILVMLGILADSIAYLRSGAA